MYTYKKLKALSYKELQTLCSKHHLSGKGKKVVLISNLLDFQEEEVDKEKRENGTETEMPGQETHGDVQEGNQNSVRIVEAMNTMMETQAAMMKQQVENQQMIMKLFHTNEKGSSKGGSRGGRLQGNN